MAWSKQRPEARYASPPAFARNTVLLQKGRCVQETPGSMPNSLQLIPDDEKEWFWPTAGVYAGKKVYVFVQRMTRSKGNDWKFEQSGVDVAVFSLSREGFPLLERLVDTPSSPLAAGEPAWGAAVLQEGPWVYVYGTYRPDEPMVFGNHVYVARVRASELTDRSRWEFWSERGWSASSRNLVSLLGPVAGPENVFSVLPVAGSDAVALVSKSDGFLGPALSLWVSSSKTGSFSPVDLDLVQARSRPDEGSGDELMYMGLAHPQFSSLSGRQWTLGVSVSRNSTNLRKVTSSMLFYRPQFHTVTVLSPFGG